MALLVPFDGEEEAVRLANDTPYGLSGAVHTGDVERGVRFAQRIDTGMIHVNDGTIGDEPLGRLRRREGLRPRPPERRGHGGGLHHPEVDLGAARAEPLPVLGRSREGP